MRMKLAMLAAVSAAGLALGVAATPASAAPQAKVGDFFFGATDIGDVDDSGLCTAIPTTTVGQQTHRATHADLDVVSTLTFYSDSACTNQVGVTVPGPVVAFPIVPTATHYIAT